MSDSLVVASALAIIFGGALVGLLLGRTLPDHHLTADTRNAVSLSVAVVGTMSALVLGLLISTAHTAFSNQANDVRQIAVDIIRVNRLLERYGPEAAQPRAELRTYTALKTRQLFGDRVVVGLQPRSEGPLPSLEHLEDQIVSLAPANPEQQWLREKALSLTDGMAKSRWDLAVEERSTIPLPLLAFLVFWLAIVFASFGLFAPRNPIALSALLLCSLAVSGGILLILEMDAPFEGLVRISPDSMQRALAEVG